MFINCFRCQDLDLAEFYLTFTRTDMKGCTEFNLNPLTGLGETLIKSCIKVSISQTRKDFFAKSFLNKNLYRRRNYVPNFIVNRLVVLEKLL